jgi:predicted TIM-barrel fold metal-dependent hydrolase
LRIEEPNNLIFEAVSKCPKRFIGFCCVDPLFKNKAVKEIERCISLGFKGIGEIALDLYQASTDLTTMVKATTNLIRNIEHVDVPILFHVGDYHYSTPKVIEKIISEFPEKTTIMGHMGSLKHLLDDVISIAKRHENDYLDAAFAFLDRESIGPEKDDPAIWSPSPDSCRSIRKAISELGPERMIFGSVSFSDEEMQRELKKIEAANLTVKEKN